MSTELEELNGLHPEKLREITDSFRDPEVLEAVSGPWRARVQWQGGFRARSHMRTHTVTLDEPDGLDATDTAASAHELILSAVGSCMMVGFVLNATKRGIKIHDFEIAVEGNFADIGKWAGVSEGNPGYGGVTAKAFVRADADEATIRELWRLAVDGSPVTQTVRRETRVDTDIELA
jgi:uncharacterized OsmC-like protein